MYNKNNNINFQKKRKRTKVQLALSLLNKQATGVREEVTFTETLYIRTLSNSARNKCCR